MKTKTNLKAGEGCPSTDDNGNKLLYEKWEMGKKTICVYERK